MELNFNTCRWPVGEMGGQDFGFCGNQTDYEKPYCAVHCEMAYQPNVRRTRGHAIKRENVTTALPRKTGSGYS